MDDENVQLEMHSLETLERTLRVEAAAVPEQGEGGSEEVVHGSASGFAFGSASGFAFGSASGFAFG